MWAGAVKSAYQAQVCIEKNKPVTTFAEDIKSLFDKNLHKLLLTLPVGGILIFTILPADIYDSHGVYKLQQSKQPSCSV